MTYDLDTGLYFGGDRPYDPYQERYLSESTAGLATNDLYKFQARQHRTKGIPTGQSDPSGFVPEWVHMGLDAVGLAPGIGIVADLTNATLYWAEGRNVEAGISAFAAIPAAGYAGITAQAAKYGTKAAQAGRLYKATKAADVGLNLAESGYYGYEGYQTGNLTQVGLATLGLGVNGTVAARALGPHVIA